MPLTLDVLPRGHEIAPAAFDLSTAWVDEYIAAVEDDAVRALGEDLVPPMAIAALAIRALLDGTALPPGAVHAGQELRFLRPVRAGERLSARAGRRGSRRTAGPSADGRNQSAHAGQDQPLRACRRRPQSLAHRPRVRR